MGFITGLEGMHTRFIADFQTEKKTLAVEFMVCSRSSQ